VQDAYRKIFDRLGIGRDTYITYASGGDFTDDFSFEYQTQCSNGEDTVYLDRSSGIGYNREVATKENEKIFGVKFSELEQVRACESGNIFYLGTKYAEDFGYRFTDSTGKAQYPYMGCYGIGISRVMGVTVENMSTDQGLRWSKNIAPFAVHIIGLNLHSETARRNAEETYRYLQSAGAEVLFDDRADAGTGEKFRDAQLIGIPIQVVISDSTPEGAVELLEDGSSSRIVSFEELVGTIDGET
jgi:prolyl-tRNA synthetase